MWQGLHLQQSTRLDFNKFGVMLVTALVIRRLACCSFWKAYCRRWHSLRQLAQFQWMGLEASVLILATNPKIALQCQTDVRHWASLGAIVYTPPNFFT